VKNQRKRRLILKFFAVIFSFVIWFYVLSSTSVILNKNVKINYILPKGYSLASNVPNSIRYKLKGPRAIINNLISKEETLDIDLSKKFNARNRRFNITYLDYSKKFPFSVKTLDAEPKNIQIYLVKNSMRTVPIKLTTIYSAQEDYLITKLVTKKKRVKLIGAKSVINSISQIETTALDLSALTEDTSITLSLVNPDIRLNYDLKSVDVQVKVKKMNDQILVEEVPISFNSKKAIISSSHKTVDLVLKRVKNFDRESFIKDAKINANIKNLNSKKHLIKLDIDLPDGYTLLKSSVDTIEVKTGK